MSQYLSYTYYNTNIIGKDQIFRLSNGIMLDSFEENPICVHNPFTFTKMSTIQIRNTIIPYLFTLINHINTMYHSTLDHA